MVGAHSRCSSRLGVGFVLETGVETLQHTVQLFDKMLLVLVPCLMVALGFLQGLATGLLLALIHFVCMYSGLPIVRWQQTGLQLRSNTVRPMYANAVLDVRGHHNVVIGASRGRAAALSLVTLELGGRQLGSLVQRCRPCRASAQPTR